MYKNIFIIISLSIVTKVGLGQTDSIQKIHSITISGAVDGYYRMALNSKKVNSNNFTSFTNSNQQFKLGMATVKMDYASPAFTATVDLGFGKRANEFSYNDREILANIKQVYISYSVSERIKITAGKWATPIGYELLDPHLNSNYSMSYGFSYGPFFHTGIKADIAINRYSGLLLGIANPTDNLNAIGPYKVIIGQFNQKLFDDKTNLFINYQGGKTGTESNYAQWDLVLTNKLHEKFSVNYDGTIFMSMKSSIKKNWNSNAIYLNYDPNPTCRWTYRSEFFYDKNAISAGVFATNIFANTLSLNYKLKQLTLLPEIRLESAKAPIYINKDGKSTSQSASFILAMIYKF